TRRHRINRRSTEQGSGCKRRRAGRRPRATPAPRDGTDDRTRRDVPCPPCRGPWNAQKAARTVVASGHRFATQGQGQGDTSKHFRVLTQCSPDKVWRSPHFPPTNTENTAQPLRNSGRLLWYAPVGTPVLHDPGSLPDPGPARSVPPPRAFAP